MNKHRLFHKGHPSVVKPVFDLNNKFSKRSPAKTFLMVFVRCLLCNRIWLNGLSGKSSDSLFFNDANRLPGHFTYTCRVSVNSSKRSYFFVPTYEPKERKHVGA